MKDTKLFRKVWEACGRRCKSQLPSRQLWAAEPLRGFLPLLRVSLTQLPSHTDYMLCSNST